MPTTAEFWDSVAEKYARSPIRDMDSYQYTLGRTRSYLAKTDKVLELGCGSGSTALLLAESVGRMTSTDIAPAMIEIARRKAAEAEAGNVRFEAAGILDAPRDDAPYDAVLAFNLLHLVRDVEGALAHINGLLKPGGLFISKTICRPVAGFSFQYVLMRLALPVMRALGKAPFVAFRSIADWEAMITAAGFEIVETGNHPAQPPSRYIVARKR